MCEYKVIVDNPIFKKPKLNQKIFRYMDYFKFEDLLNSSELYFSRIDKQEDDHEGKILIERPSEVEYFRKPYEELSKNTYINCWRMDNNISHDISLWDEYCTDSKHSVAIESSYERFCNSIICCSRNIIIGMVQYEYDENKLKKEMDYIYMFKRPKYKRESELRAVIPLQSYIYFNCEINPHIIPDEHMRVLINLDKLIYRVHISPKASIAFANKVKTFIDKCSNFRSIPSISK